MTTEYKKEFFDRNYTLREAYGRVWKYARKYRFRLFVGVICGMLTAGTLVPLFQIVQPTMDHVESHADSVDISGAALPAQAENLPRQASDTERKHTYGI